MNVWLAFSLGIIAGICVEELRYYFKQKFEVEKNEDF